ncbi:MAG: hypothetical protein AB1486_34690 [Planctomycetota bacterium]
MERASPEALFRFQLVSQVRARVLGGESLADVVRAVTSLSHLALDGSSRQVRPRTLYRWLSLYAKGGLAALEPQSRPHAISRVLSPELLDFLILEKRQDKRASIPELIKRARERGVLKQDQVVDRTTVFRSLRRLQLPLGRIKRTRDRDVRRYAYPHRLDMVLCDGVHFRAGVTRAKRVAMHFLDDAARFVLHAVVGTSETAALFLRGLYEMIRRYGYFGIIYIDLGPGFIAEDTVAVIAQLGALLIHGEAAYPEGHGAIERFHQTERAALLDRWDGRPDIDPACPALELRLRHYTDEIYNHEPHASLGGHTPWQRFSTDKKPLRFPQDDQELRAHFQVTLQRRVYPDQIVSVDSIPYEMPRGYAGHHVVLQRKVLDNTVHFLHQGRLIELHPADLTANARAPRLSPAPDRDESAEPLLPKSAADLAFEQRYRPVVDADGGFTDNTQEKES